jgi:hypothetical protein
LPPGLCIAILGAGLAFVNFGIDELANPRLRNEPRPKKAIRQNKRQEVELQKAEMLDSHPSNDAVASSFAQDG